MTCSNEFSCFDGKVIRNIPNYNNAGIYMFHGINNPYLYIGSSVNVSSRLKTHDSNLYYLKINGMGNAFTSNKWEKLIKPEFLFEAEILEIIPQSLSQNYMRSREQYWLESHESEYLLNDATINVFNCTLENISRSMRRASRAFSKNDHMQCREAEQQLRKTLLVAYKTLLPLKDLNKQYKHERLVTASK